MINVDPHLADSLVIFDGDISNKDLKRIKKYKYNCLTLPTPDKKKESPERTLWNFIFSDMALNYLEKEYKSNEHVKLEYFREHDIKPNPSIKDREVYKNWFKYHKQLFDDSKIFHYWRDHNKDIIEDFINNFKKAFNRIACKKNLPSLK